MISRRDLLVGALAGGLGLRPAPDAREAELRRGLAALERRHGGRLGVAVFDGATGRRTDYRGGERFLMCSTSKALAAGFVLARVDRGQESLERRIVYGRDALVAHSPTTERHVEGKGLSLGEIAEAALTLSDNAAMNLMLDGFGGPAALTAYLRSIGDRTTRQDRREPALNEFRPGDPRDTTTPSAMVETLRRLLLGSTLSTASRAQLERWLAGSRTGDRRLRAGVPKGWRAGDKTGTGSHGEANDVAILRPPTGAPLLVVAFYVNPTATPEVREAVLAGVGRLAGSLREAA